MHLLHFTINRGKFSIVRVAKHKQTKARVAVKRVDRKICPSEQLVKEVEIMKRLRDCRGAIQLIDVFEEPGKPFTNLVLELVTGGELFEFIVKSTSYSEKSAADYARQLCETVAVLHSRNIIHRDLKPENLLFEDESAKTLKLCDFGLADTLKNEEEQLTWAVGTKCYMAPEVTTGNGYGKPVDMYSIGVIIYVLLCGYLPIDPENGVDFLEFPDKEWDGISPEVKTLIAKLLADNPSERPTAAQVLQHPWVRGNNTSNKPLVGTVRNLKTLRATAGRGGGGKVRPNIMDIAFNPPDAASAANKDQPATSSSAPGPAASTSPSKSNHLHSNQANPQASLTPKGLEKWLDEPRVSLNAPPAPVASIYNEAYLNRLSIFKEITMWITTLVSEENRAELSDLLPKYNSQLEALTALRSDKTSLLHHLENQKTLNQARLKKLQAITSETVRIEGKSVPDWIGDVTAHLEQLDADIIHIQAQIESTSRLQEALTRDREDVASKLSANVSKEEIDSLLSGTRSRYLNECSKSLKLLLNTVASGGAWAQLSPLKILRSDEDLQIVALELSAFCIHIQDDPALLPSQTSRLTSSVDGEERPAPKLPTAQAMHDKLKGSDLNKVLAVLRTQLGDVREAILLSPKNPMSSLSLALKHQELIKQAPIHQQARQSALDGIDVKRVEVAKADAVIAEVVAKFASIQEKHDANMKTLHELNTERQDLEQQTIAQKELEIQQLERELAEASSTQLNGSAHAAEAHDLHSEHIRAVEALVQERLQLEEKAAKISRSIRG